LEVAVLDLVGAFESAGGGKRPATPARSLVLDRGHGTGSLPIHRSGNTHKVLGGSVNGGGGGTKILAGRLGDELHVIPPFNLGHPRKLVESLGVGVGGIGIVSLNLLDLVDEDLEALSVHSAVLFK